MDGQSSLKVLVLTGVVMLGLSACACKQPKPSSSTRPMSSASKKAGFGAAGAFTK